MIIVSNRLPFTITHERGELKFSESVGGLATGLRTFLSSLQNSQTGIEEYVWVGWPGSTIEEELREGVRSKALAEHRCLPVFFSEQDFENFYQGFCNKTIWPLFHYFPGIVQYVPEYWEQYRKVNEAFCAALTGLIQPGDIVWIHDYHLLLLPGLLRAHFPDVPIGFFLHIPFPTFELFRLLPGAWRRELLEGMLGANQIGFHTYDYMQDFLRCTLRILGTENNMGEIVLSDRLVRVGSYPMGIDYQRFESAASSPEVAHEREELLKSLGGSRIILSVDRLDYSKGILNRLQGFETLLEQHEEWRGNVTLLVIVVPSRIGVGDYELMKKQIEEVVGRINGRFGGVSWTPIIYQFRSLPFTSLVSIYTVSHIALVTPLRDGMNLIAKEYIASRPDKTGVLILSEMAGAAKELGEAVLVNPNIREEIVQALKEALEMPLDEQVRRNQIMQSRLQRYTVGRWAKDIIQELTGIRRREETLFSNQITAPGRAEIVRKYGRASRRLLFLDYDGTLVGFTRRPVLARPGDEVLAILRKLGEDPRNEVVIVSGRRKSDLQDFLGSLPVGLVAEHGAWMRELGGEWTMLKTLTSDWKPKIIPILEAYSDRFPGSTVEEKDYSLVWHYRGTDPEQGKLTAMELMDDLHRFTANIDLQVLQGKKIIEVRNSGINKGLAALHWFSKGSFEFIMAIGDDSTDEDLFAAMPPDAVSIRVGIGRTQARSSLRTPKDVVNLLGQLAKEQIT
ncbi:MAG TPA: bifunctional alpha,alpha-trehalose-phosphate synthase (UDP-forming)/trehalose-phosphatase [Bacteroidota bacterium]|jgi:trehalose 6-phosphate synthase/phosphatase